MHSIVSDINRAFAVEGSCTFSEEELKELAKETLYLPYLDKNTQLYENLEKRCINSTIAYYNDLHEDNNATIEYVEQKVEVPITESIILKGRIDLAKKVDKVTNKSQVYIVDFKTQSNRNEDKQHEKDIAFKQLLIYCLGYEQLT